MWQEVANWLRTYESVAIWLEGVALVLIFIWDRIDANEQQKEMLKQLEVMRKQVETMQLQAAAAQDNVAAGKLSAQALVNSERAWVVAGVRPYARRFSGGSWSRVDGAALSTEDVLAGKHLIYWLTLTNLGRGPAQILGFTLIYTCLAEGVTDLPDSGGGERVLKSYRPFELLLGGDGEAIEISEPIDMGGYMEDDIDAIKGLKKTAVIHGWIKYRHMLSTADDCYADFCYVYTVSEEKLTAVGRHTRQRQEKAS
jgi:hypothetical protein